MTALGATRTIRCVPCGSTLFSENSVCATCLSRTLKNLPREWKESALCNQVDPELWFPESYQLVDALVFKTCLECPVRRTCLEAGLHEQDGIWAGYTPKDRASLRKITHKLSKEQRDVVLDQFARP